MNKTLKIILTSLLGIVILVVIAGIIKFNFINDDVVIVQPDAAQPINTPVIINEPKNTTSNNEESNSTSPSRVEGLLEPAEPIQELSVDDLAFKYNLSEISQKEFLNSLQYYNANKPEITFLEDIVAQCGTSKPSSMAEILNIENCILEFENETILQTENLPHEVYRDGDCIYPRHGEHSQSLGYCHTEDDFIFGNTRGYFLGHYPVQGVQLIGIVSVGHNNPEPAYYTTVSYVSDRSGDPYNDKQIFDLESGSYIVQGEQGITIRDLNITDRLEVLSYKDFHDGAHSRQNMNYYTHDAHWSNGKVRFAVSEDKDGILVNYFERNHSIAEMPEFEEPNKTVKLKSLDNYCWVPSFTNYILNDYPNCEFEIMEDNTSVVLDNDNVISEIKKQNRRDDLYHYASLLGEPKPISSDEYMFKITHRQDCGGAKVFYWTLNTETLEIELKEEHTYVYPADCI